MTFGEHLEEEGRVQDHIHAGTSNRRPFTGYQPYAQLSVRWAHVDVVFGILVYLPALLQVIGL